MPLCSVPLMLVTNAAPKPPVSETLLVLGPVHVYFVLAGTMPLMPFAGLTSNDKPLQIVVLIGVITAFGST